MAIGAWGLYIYEDEETGGKRARVKYGKLAKLNVSEDQYRASGYAPDFDELPSKEEFERRTNSGENKASV